MMSKMSYRYKILRKLCRLWSCRPSSWWGMICKKDLRNSSPSHMRYIKYWKNIFSILGWTLSKQDKSCWLLRGSNLVSTADKVMSWDNQDSSITMKNKIGTSELLDQDRILFGSYSSMWSYRWGSIYWLFHMVCIDWLLKNYSWSSQYCMRSSCYWQCILNKIISISDMNLKKDKILSCKSGRLLNYRKNKKEDTLNIEMLSSGRFQTNSWDKL